MIVYVVMGEEISTDHGNAFEIVSIHKDEFDALEAKLDWQARSGGAEAYTDEWEVK